MKRYFGAEGICLTNDLSASIRASKAMQKAVKKANADALCHFSVLTFRCNAFLGPGMLDQLGREVDWWIGAFRG